MNCKIQKEPEILVIHLKRFSFNRNSNSWEKIKTPIAIDMDISLNKYNSMPSRNSYYKLFGVIHHLGSL